jgi:hypothetical protein
MLRTDVLATQCQFLASAYLFYTVRPLEAWNLLSSTSMKLQLLVPGPLSPTDKRVSERIYWNTLLFERHVIFSSFHPMLRLTQPVIFSPNLSSPIRALLNSKKLLSFLIHSKTKVTKPRAVTSCGIFLPKLPSGGCSIESATRYILSRRQSPTQQRLSLLQLNSIRSLLIGIMAFRSQSSLSCMAGIPRQQLFKPCCDYDTLLAGQ